jgi:hypothetical protein
MNKEIKYYKKATVIFKESKKVGRHFHYTDYNLKNCLVQVEGSNATILEFHPKANFFFTYFKRTYGLYFSFNGVECSKISYNRLVKNIIKKRDKQKTINETMAILKKAVEQKKEKDNIEIVKNVINEKYNLLQQVNNEQTAQFNLIENTLTKQVRYLDKLVDELAKGKKMEKILRTE